MPRSARISSSIAQAEAEHVVQPEGMTDDLGGKPMAIVWVGRCFMPPVSPATGQPATSSYREYP